MNRPKLRSKEIVYFLACVTSYNKFDILITNHEKIYDRILIERIRRGQGKSVRNLY